MLYRISLLGCAGIASLAAASVQAQTAERPPVGSEQTPPPAPAAPTPVEPSAKTPAPPPPTDTGDIIITAQRRSQRLIDVPISVTAIGEAALDKSGITNLIDLTKVTPGVILTKSGAYLQPTIRGIGTSAIGPGADPNVAIYLDGVYQSSQNGNIFELANVSDIEILKGPQGTLFGRNATGGAILIKLKDPSFETTGRVKLSYGRFNEVLGSTYASTGLTEKIAIDLAAYYRHSDGWVRDLRSNELVNNQYSFDVRSKLLFEISNFFKVTLSVAHNATSDPTSFTTVAANGNSAGRPRPNSGPIATERLTTSNDFKNIIRNVSTSAALHADLDVGAGTIASITSYKTERGTIHGDFDGSYAAVQNSEIPQRFRDFTQEVNFTSAPGGPLSYVLGVFYFRERAGQPGFRNNGVQLYNATVNTDAVSAYADGSYKVGAFSLIGGLRYSIERKEHTYSPGSTGVNTVDTNNTFKDFTPRVGVSYALDPRSNLYATFSKGFKSGTYNISGSTTAFVEPEKVDAYEVGFKHQDRSFSLNAAGYLYKYQNIQINAFDFAQGISRLVNAARARIYGFDLDGRWQVDERLAVRGAVAYTHARFTDFPGAITFVPIGGNNGNRSVIADATGNPLIRAPDWTLSGGIDYAIPLGENRLSFSLTPYYSSRVQYSFNKRNSQAPYATLDAFATYTIDGKYSISLYGRNITDTKYAFFRSATSTRDTVGFATPRTYGVQFGYDF